MFVDDCPIRAPEREGSGFEDFEAPIVVRVHPHRRRKQAGDAIPQHNRRRAMGGTHPKLHLGLTTIGHLTVTGARPRGIPDYVMNARLLVNCPLCHATGRCTECGGEGVLACVFCNGRGCPDCDSTGFVTCVPCDRTGHCWRCEGTGLMPDRRHCTV